MFPSANPGAILLVGENPYVWLSETQGGPMTTQASVWTIVYSEKGAGHALFIKSELTGDEWRIYTDNVEMSRWLQSTVQGMLNPESADPSIPVIEAAFSRHGDPRDSWTEEIKSAEDEIAITWRDIREPVLMSHQDASDLPNRPYGVSAVMVPAGGARLTLNGKAAGGRLWPMDVNGYPLSTGGLAFAESWREER